VNNTTALVILIILIAASAFFSASETSMIALNRYRLKHLVKKGNKTAKRISHLLNTPDKLIGVLLIGNTFANLLFSSIFTQWAINNFGELGLLESIALTVVSSLVLLIFSESTPKTFAALYPQSIAFPASLPIKILLYVLYPIVLLITAIGNLMLKAFGVHISGHHKHHEPLSYEELRTIVHESSEKIPTPNTNMLIRLLDLNYATVEDAMVPRNEIEAVDLDNDWSQIQKQVLKWPHSEILFYNSEIDDIAGIIPVKNIFNLVISQKLNKENLRALLEECYYIPESTTLTNQLINFQNNHRKSGLVVDEYGDITGYISLQDILEEVVGEFDQANNNNESDEISIQKDGSVIIQGSANIRDINRELHWHLPEDGPRTLSGLIIEYLEHIPDNPVGLYLNSYRIEVLQIQKNTITLVKILKN
jgi:Mg2+/Co2+ transporter CorB